MIAHRLVADKKRGLRFAKADKFARNASSFKNLI